MISYKRIVNEHNLKRYEYYPNGNTSAPGIVEFVKGEKPKLIKESPEDVKMYYAVHALNDIDTSTESGVVAWH